MIRAMIEWNMVSPFLQLAKGILKVEDVDLTYQTDPELLIECEVDIKPGQHGFHSISYKGIPTKIFDEVKPFIDIMMHSYFSGLKLHNFDVVWIDDKHIDSEVLKKMRGDEDVDIKTATGRELVAAQQE